MNERNMGINEDLYHGISLVHGGICWVIMVFINDGCLYGLYEEWM